MLYLNGFDDKTAVLPYPVIAIGVFDGVHRGHQAILGRISERARELGGTSVLLTFDPHPQKIISPGDAPLLLQTAEQKQRILSELGVDVLVQLPFTRRLSLLTPEEFVSSVLLSHGIREIHVGRNFRFGHRRSGDFQMLEALGDRKGLQVLAVEPLLFRGNRISSTWVRKSLLKGVVSLSRQLLGRPYQVEGTVVRGDKRGARLGFPTANLQLRNELVPAPGVYATCCCFNGRRLLSVTNIGYLPTFFESSRRQLSVETHLLDFEGDLYGKSLALDFCFRIRGERKFDSIDNLRCQIRRDVDRALAVLSRDPGPPKRWIGTP